VTKNHLKLSESDKIYLENLLSKGTLAAKKFKRTTALLALDRDESFKAVSHLVNVRHQTVSSWCKKYHEGGLSFLTDKPRPGRPIEIDGSQRAKITALACSEAPEGYERWSLRLLADRAVELGYCDQLSHTYAGKLLKKTR
jgi:transposase